MSILDIDQATLKMLLYSLKQQTMLVNMFETCHLIMNFQKELDDIIAGIAVKHNNRVFAERLQNAGVSAAPVNPASETLADEHLNARGFWNLVGLPETDPRQPDFLISADVPKSMPRNEKTFKPGPAMGQDNEWILKELLHLTGEEIEEAKNDDAFI